MIKDTPFTLNIAVLCNIVADDCTDSDFPNRDVKSMCSLFENAAIVVSKLIIYPTCGSTSNESTMDSVLTCNSSSSKEMLPLLIPDIWKREESELLHTVPAVCTVQTFLNSVSGPMLYMFTRYYLELDWVVIIYDRFGSHRTFLTDFLNHTRLKYFPFTMFQLMFPNTYNNEFVRSQVSDSNDAG